MGLLNWLAKQGENAQAENQRKAAVKSAYTQGRGDAIAYAKKQTATLSADQASAYQRGWDEGIAERQATARQKASERRKADKRMYEDSVPLA